MSLVYGIYINVNVDIPFLTQFSSPIGYDSRTWYAMKTLSKAVILERNHVAMVMKERHLLARLHCPQLVNMHYAFQVGCLFFFLVDISLIPLYRLLENI